MNDDRRVLQVLGRSAGGIARHVARIVAALDGRDDLVIDVAGPPDLPVAMPKPVRDVLVPDGLGGHRRAVARLRSIIREGGYDVVHAHGLRAGIDAGRARTPGVRVLMTVHNLVRPEVAGRARSALYKLAEPLAVLLTDHTFAVSEDIAGHLRRVSPRGARKIEVVYLGSGDVPEVSRPPEAVRAELGLSQHHRLVMTASRLAPQKALHVMLRALHLLPEQVVLAVVGQGPLEKELKSFADTLGVSARVRWLGWRPNVADYIAAAEVFCLSSTWEGVPLAAQEAMLLGTPVVATDVGGTGELIRDGSSGRLVPADDPGRLAEALQELLSSADARGRYAQAARADVVERFSTERMLARLSDAYRGRVRVD